jgi:hypothetical protein
MSNHVIKPGDRVRYSADFLRLLRWGPDLDERHGLVTSREAEALVRVIWDDSKNKEVVHVANLLKVEYGRGKKKRTKTTYKGYRIIQNKSQFFIGDIYGYDIGPFDSVEECRLYINGYELGFTHGQTVGKAP